jgi:hypothetical protein
VRSYTRLGASFGTPNGYLRGISIDVDGGSFYDGTSYGFAVTPRANVGRHFEVRARYQLDRLRFPGQPGLDAHITRVRLDHQISVRTSWSGFVQYSSAADAVAANIRFRFNPREGNDVYVVYNAGLDTEHFRDSFVPLAPVQTLLIKLSFTTGPGT